MTCDNCQTKCATLCNTHRDCNNNGATGFRCQRDPNDPDRRKCIKYDGNCNSYADCDPLIHDKCMGFRRTKCAVYED